MDRLWTVSYLKIFGCMAYYYIPKAYRNKLQPRAKEGIFIGYSQETRGYRIYDPEDKKIRAVKTAKFDGNLKGSALLNTRYESMDNDVALLYGTEQEEDEPKEDPIVIEEETNDIEDTEEINDGREYVEPRQEDVVRRRGRRLGVTNEDIENTKKVELQIREERLREQGVRRSERIGNKKQQANTAKHVLIPMNFTQASNSAEAEEWNKAMEREISAMDCHKVWKIVPRNQNMKIMKSK
ncbi:hypothetical protein KM043_018220 [Ampulex compressa]|nr:hypothetical protein KM043_018220 [Ampulex compressa]